MLSSLTKFIRINRGNPKRYTKLQWINTKGVNIRQTTSNNLHKWGRKWENYKLATKLIALNTGCDDVSTMNGETGSNQTVDINYDTNPLSTKRGRSIASLSSNSSHSSVGKKSSKILKPMPNNIENTRKDSINEPIILKGIETNNTMDSNRINTDGSSTGDTENIWMDTEGPITTTTNQPDRRQCTTRNHNQRDPIQGRKINLRNITFPL